MINYRGHFTLIMRKKPLIKTYGAEIKTIVWKKKYLIKWSYDKQDLCIGYVSVEIPLDRCCCDGRIPGRIFEEVRNMFRLGDV